MIVKLFSSGKSFKGLARYLTTDPKANTAERVAWTHTLNLASDAVSSAVHEMLWTYRAADQLKRQAGVPTGGSGLKNPVKHFSLNWHRSEQPNREQMIEAAREFLAHMGWNEHQAAIVCHTDRQPHVHVMVNVVHPETGRALDTGFEKRRAQEWALAYEREHARVFCEQRLKPKEEREPNPTREAWQKLNEAERQHDLAEAARLRRTPDYFERGDPEHHNAKEWEFLKGEQREERMRFFAEGKQAFREVRNAVFREVRTEFREEWKGYYQAKRKGASAEKLAKTKADILARQNEELDRRREAACAELREQRDADYGLLLIRQRWERAHLTARQEQGQHSPQLLDKAHDRQDGSSEAAQAGRETSSAFGLAAKEVCNPARAPHAAREERSEPEPFESHSREHSRVRDGVDVASGLGLGALGAIAAIGERIFDGFFGGGEQKSPAPPPPHDSGAEERRQDREARAAAAQVPSAEVQAREAAELHAYWQERARRRGRERD